MICPHCGVEIGAPLEPTMTIAPLGALTISQRGVLAMLMAHPNQTVSGQVLWQALYAERDNQAGLAAVRVVVRNLRHRLQQLGSSIEIRTIYGEGYAAITQALDDQ